MIHGRSFLQKEHGDAEEELEKLGEQDRDRGGFLLILTFVLLLVLVDALTSNAFAANYQ